MAIDKKDQLNVDNSDLGNYPNGRIRDNDGSGNGTAVNRTIYSDIHEFFAKALRRNKTPYNGQPDNETNGYQLIDAVENLAGKNNKIQSLTTSGGEILINLRLGSIVENEFLVCKVNFDLTAQTIIKGIDTPTPVSKAISFSPSDKPFKSGETLRLFYNGSSFIATRLADADNIDLLIGERNYLKAATEAEEYAAASQTKSTTPYTNALAFARRVFGVDSDTFLANSSRNGIYPKEHFDIVENLGANPVKNEGWFSGLDVGDTTGSLSINGDITSATATKPSAGNSIVTVNLANSMNNLNYRVDPSVEGLSSNLNTSNDIGYPVWKIISVSQFQIGFREIDGDVQNLKVHIKVTQL